MNMERWKQDLRTGRGRLRPSRPWRRLGSVLALGVLVTVAALGAPGSHALEGRGWQACHQGPALDAPGAGHLLTGGQLLGRLGGDEDEDDDGDCNP
jgi:hypothetical protein